MADNELTPQQEKEMIELRDHYIGLLSNLKLNKEMATESTGWLYSLINLPAPRTAFVVSPLHAQYFANGLEALNTAGLI